MRNTSWIAVLLVGSGLALTSCGGGSNSNGSDSESQNGGTSASTLSGTAATGAPIVNGAVTAICAGGPGFTQAVQTDSDGKWTGTLNDASVLPCALRVSYGSPAKTLHSYADAIGTVNITPLTDLALALATSMVPDTWFNGFTGTPPVGLDVQTTNLLNQLKIFGYDVPNTGSPFTTVFVADGTGWDKVLEQLQDAIDNPNDGINSYEDLVNLVKDGNLPNIPSAPISSSSGNGSTGEPGTGGNATACFDASLLALGTKIHQEFQTTDSSASGVTFNTTSDSEVTQQTTFKANSATESVTQQTTVASNPLFNSDSTTKNYFRLDGTKVLGFGSVTSTTAASTVFQTTASFSPAREDRHDLNPGDSYVQTYTVTSETSSPPGSVPVATTIVETRTYVGQETVNVPAGTFANACKFIDESAVTTNGFSSTGTRTEWLAAGSGLLLKTIAGIATTVLTDAAINSAPITP